MIPWAGPGRKYYIQHCTPAVESGMGKGLKAYMSIKNGAIIGTYLGELKKTPPKDSSLTMEAKKGFYIDTKEKSNLLRFINHGYSRNCEAVKRVIDGHNTLWVISLEPISSGSFLSIHYHRKSYNEILCSICKSTC